MEKLLNFYSKYPWTALIILIHWLAVAGTVYYSRSTGQDLTTIFGVSFLATVIYSYVGFKAPKAS